MRKPRATWRGAFHHVMNRGIKDESILETPSLKEAFLALLEERSKLLKIRIFAYCIMDNHYHLVLENTSGRMSDFLKQVNGQYAMIYRKNVGGQGYVFQNRYKSTLIENDSYLMTSIAYTLLNPVRAGLVRDYNRYTWSSANAYFSKGATGFVDAEFVEGSFGSNESFLQQMELSAGKELPVFNSKFGIIMGRRDFLGVVEEKFDRRKRPDASRRRRIDDQYFDPVEKVIYEFEKRYNVKIDNLKTETHHDKRLRGELLVFLKDVAGLKYKEIIEFPGFEDIKYNSLGNLYKKTKLRMEKRT